MPSEAGNGRVVVLSPHPDDGVWSLGSGLARWAPRQEIELLSLFAGDAPAGLTRARAPEQRWRCFSTPGQRRAEDRRAAAVLGYGCSNLEAADGALRLDQGGGFAHASLQSLFLDSAPGSWPAPEPALVAALQGFLRPQDVVCAPLAIGGHVDHCLTHRLARELPNRVYFYSEFPYAEQLSQQALQGHVRALGLQLQARDIACSWPAWREAALCYRSQVLMLFAGQGRFLQALQRHCRVQGDTAFCRIWSTRAM
ncbi:PIG-L family deacetylase [Pseudomonas sp. TNT2022 ID1048]|uniref:PIG-L deacetylase family protein n=1 Tax=Pseudomonas TaxID=286 RepID=UPI00235F6516|nr:MULTISPECIES: PIG-L family deacetylase [Pseudomonas]MBW8353567.1 PIG-L family deacetylase [Pseudomonas sp.]MDD1018786.1 PIG-L family deacetylase [Pseudomonas idahonensis]